MSEEYPSLGGSAAETSSNWLTTKNSAARFAYRAFDGDSTSKTTDELIFVDELDAFVPRNKAPDLESCFASSRKEKETFEMMLKDFAQTLGAIMSIIPSDVYGSLISGGVMTILAIANEHEKRREAVESAMADIPKKLDRVQRLSDVHVWSKRLHKKADGVLAAIFGVLQRIIDDMTMDRAAKFKSKVKFGSEDQVTGALTSLDDSISDFQMELDICAQFRMGRMHETINSNGAKLSIIEKVVKGLSQDLNEGNVKAVTKETIEEHVCNALHRFYASNPHFNPVNGGLKEPLPKRQQGDLEVRIPEQNNKIVEECSSNGNTSKIN
ncbi:hypothetical protein CFRS1_v000174 [Colletotrichum fructicola]|nr:hypothetical protein CFRS1_v000174 [Colletotrichum fructicola]